MVTTQAENLERSKVMTEEGRSIEEAFVHIGDGYILCEKTWPQILERKYSIKV